MLSVDCVHAREQLQDLIDGQLAPERAAVLERHLESCAACRSLLEELRTID
ncbi:MAG: hypothetical protein GF400_11250, partial [Candidatus Eisenbacteria bacterium]|nr:hypothetical protein [Candidatus Eisenbacteria bacterium]